LGFDPYTLQLANGPLAQEQNNGLPASLQNSNADSSRAGQWYNGALYAGLSSTAFGTLTVGRQNTLTLDGEPAAARTNPGPGPKNGTTFTLRRFAMRGR
jgi:predicted porin